MGAMVPDSNIICLRLYRLLSDVPGANKQAWWLFCFCKKQEFIVILWY